jgi:hypothetical protein
MLFLCVVLSEEDKIMVFNCGMYFPRDNFILWEPFDIDITIGQFPFTEIRGIFFNYLM